MTKTAQQAFKETAEKNVKHTDTYRAFIHGIDCMIDESINSGKYFVSIPLRSADRDFLPDIINYYKALDYKEEYIFGRFGLPMWSEIRWYD